jgi:hypothetical protein
MYLPFQIDPKAPQDDKGALRAAALVILSEAKDLALRVTFFQILIFSATLFEGSSVNNLTE